MARHTFATASDTICKLDAQRDVYKVEVDEAKWALTHAFESDVKRAKEDTYLSIPHEDRSASDARLYFDAPYSMVHWYGKKWAKALGEAQDSALKSELIRIRDLYESTFQLLQSLAARQIKGRKPAPKKEVIATRTQLRAICPCCFRQQAVRNGRLVAHGYTLDYGYKNGECRGTGEMHFGTVEGRDVTKTLAADAYNQAIQLREQMDRYSKGEEHITLRRFDRVSHQWVAISYPTEQQKSDYIRERLWDADGLMRYAGELRKHVENWVPVDPVEVQVEVTA